MQHSSQRQHQSRSDWGCCDNTVQIYICLFNSWLTDMKVRPHKYHWPLEMKSVLCKSGKKVFEVSRNPKPHLKSFLLPVIERRGWKKRRFPSAKSLSCTVFLNQLCLFVISLPLNVSLLFFLSLIQPPLVLLWGWKARRERRWEEK